MRDEATTTTPPATPAAAPAVVFLPAAEPARPRGLELTSEAGLSIQDRVRLRALEAARA